MTRDLYRRAPIRRFAPDDPASHKRAPIRRFAPDDPAHDFLTRTLMLFALLALVGCGGQVAFSSRYPDNHVDQVRDLLMRLRDVAPREVAPIAVGVTSEPTKLYAYDLAGHRVLWETPVAATSEPFLAGNYVLVQSGAAVVGYDLATGRKQFSDDADGLALNGAGGIGGAVAYSVTRGLGTQADSEVVLVRGNSVAWRRPMKGQAGSPDILGDTVLVPWGSQFVSALDLETGKEYARVRVRDGVFGHVLVRDREAYLGSAHGITRVSPSIGSGSFTAGGQLPPPPKELPGRPELLRDVYRPGSVQPPGSAQHRIALAFQPTLDAAGRLVALDDNFYSVFYRFVFALHPATLAVRWVYVHDADIVGAAAESGGIVFADEAGGFGALGARSGALVWHERSAPATNVARIPASAGAAVTPGEAPDPVTLRGKLLAAAQEMDSRLVPARLLAVELLSQMEDAEATANLITICDDDRMAPPVRRAACDSLEKRSLGTDHLLATLERHASFLRDTTVPPVGALARAAATQKEKRAVGPLVSHLQDPHTPSRDLPALVTSLEKLGDPAAAEPLAAFLRLYHADAIDEHVVHALELVPEALVALSGPVSAQTLQEVADDELGTFGVRERARIALATLEAQTKAAEQQAEAQAQDAQADPAVAEESAPAKEPEPPAYLSVAVVDQVLEPVRPSLVKCLKDTKEFQARVVLVVTQGNVEMISVMPEKLQACIEPLVHSQPFPVTKAMRREQLVYTVKRF